MFSVHKLLVDYCTRDTQVLRLGMDAYLDIVYKRFGIHALEGSVTLSSLAFRIYRTFFMPNNIYNVDSCDILANNSKIQLEWLYYLKTYLDPEKYELITVREKLSQVNINCGGKSYSVDGIIRHKDTNKLVICELAGCHFHSHMLEPNVPCKLNRMGDTGKYKSTLHRLKQIQKFYDVHLVWECEWKKLRKTDSKIKAICGEFREHISRGLISPRQGLYGGRTELYRRFYRVQGNEQLKYYDIVSLYPWIQKSHNFPVNRYFTVYGRSLPDINGFKKIMKKHPNSGIALISMRAPHQCYFPILPMKISGILSFSLCPLCSETLTFPCPHDDSQRVITGTYTYAEIEEALKAGYEIEKLHEIIFFKEVAPIFRACINTLAALKIAYSGWPADVVTEEQKKAYVEGFKAQGIEITLQEMQDSPGAKKVFKLILNSIWGRLALNTAKYKSLGLLESIEELIALYHSEGPHQIEDILNSITSDKIIYSYSEEKVRRSKDSNTILASMVTSLARIELLKAMSKLKGNLLYVDTDSVVFHTSANVDFNGQSYLIGGWTDELLEAWGPDCKPIEFISCAPKCYAIKGINTKTGKYVYIIKMKGMTLQKENQERDYENLRRVVLGENVEFPYPQTQFKLDPKSSSIRLKSIVKVLRDSSMKRHVMPNRIDTLPYGWKE